MGDYPTLGIKRSAPLDGARRRSRAPSVLSQTLRPPAGFATTPMGPSHRSCMLELELNRSGTSSSGSGRVAARPHPSPSNERLRTALAPRLCRCQSHPRVLGNPCLRAWSHRRARDGTDATISVPNTFVSPFPPPTTSRAQARPIVRDPGTACRRSRAVASQPCRRRRARHPAPGSGARRRAGRGGNPTHSWARASTAPSQEVTAPPAIAPRRRPGWLRRSVRRSRRRRTLRREAAPRPRR